MTGVVLSFFGVFFEAPSVGDLYKCSEVVKERQKGCSDVDRVFLNCGI